MKSLARLLSSALLTAAIVGTSTSCLAHNGPAASQASALSALPIAVSVAAPVVLLSGGVMLTAVAIQGSAQGAVWILESASDGARMSVTVASEIAAAASLAVGTVVTVSVIGSGWVLSAAGQAIAFIPNEIGKALLYNERVTR